ELLRERQPEAGALALSGVVGPDLAELLEDGLLVLGGDADPGVADGDLHGAVGGHRLDADPAALGGEIDGVGEEGPEELLDLPLVADKGPEPLVYRDTEGDPVAVRPLPDEGHGVLKRER